MTAPRPQVAVPADLAELAAQYPDWQFGSDWVPAASGPDLRYVWARSGGWRHRAWSAPELAVKMAAWFWE